jgi:acetylornithine deacetylase
MASPAPASLKDTVGSLDRDGFVGLLSKLIGETARRCL